MKSWINQTFRDKRSAQKTSEDSRNPTSVGPPYALLASLRIGDRTHFRSTLGALVQELGEHGVIADLGAIASQREDAVVWLTDIVCMQDDDEVLRRVAFHALRRVGTAAMPALREAWDRELSLLVRGRLHLCMMDIIGGAKNSPEQSHEMPLLAEQEIPRWIETLGTAEPRVRGWAVMILVALVPYAPAQIEEVRNRLSEFLMSDFSTDDDLSRRDFAAMRDYACRALKNLS